MRNDMEKYWEDRYESMGKDASIQLGLSEEYFEQVVSERKAQLKDIYERYDLGNVLDFGCGIGTYCRCIPAKKYTGYDNNKQAIAIAKGGNVGRRFRDDKRYVGEYDTLLTMSTLQHCDERTLNSISEMVKGRNVVLYECTDLRSDLDHCKGRTIEQYSKVVGRVPTEVIMHVVDGYQHHWMIWLK